MTRDTFVLSIHAPYGCRDRGACCTAGWPIPIERVKLEACESAIRDGRLRSPAAVTTPFNRLAHAPADTPALVVTHRSACVFYRHEGSARCEIHRTLGHGALPLACRQFPRVSVQDPRGTSITLSHFCPTAAALLDDDGSIEVVASPSAFSADGEYVGLDVREAMPPLLRPDMLMDWDSWWRWEHESVALIARSSSAGDALRRLRSVVEHVRAWQPNDGVLGELITAAFARAHVMTPEPATNGGGALELIDDVMASIPDDLRPDARPPKPATTSDRARTRFLAAHAFANWTAHLGRGLQTWLASLAAADALIGAGFSVSDADLRLRHLADPAALANRLSRCERG